MGSTPNGGVDGRRGGAGGVRVSGCWRVHLRGRVPPADERGCTVPCERRRLPGDALIEREVGRGRLEEVPVRHRLGCLVPGGRSACGRDRGWTRRLTDVGQNLLDRRGLGDVAQ